MGALPVEGEEPLGYAGHIELAVADLLHVADFEVGYLASDYCSAEGAQAFRSEEAQETNAPLTEKGHHRAPAHPAEHHATANSTFLLGLELVELAELAFFFGWEEEAELAGCLSHS